MKLKIFAIACAVSAGAPASGQGVQNQAAPQTVLFVGNSFTFGARTDVWHYRSSSVDDLNSDNVGGVPALFKRFSDESGLNYRVSVETDSGQTLRFHYEKRHAKLDQAWDHVLLQEYSTLDPKKPGDPHQFGRYAARLAAMFLKRNPKADVRLVATWSRPDLTYQKASPWKGKGIDAMAGDLQRAYAAVAVQTAGIRGVVPVGSAFSRAVAEGVADADPFDGIEPGKIDLWSDDNYHASKFGYYIEALMDFGSVTGIDPQQLGKNEQAAADLGISPEQAVTLQQIAGRQLQAARAGAEPSSS